MFHVKHDQLTLPTLTGPTGLTPHFANSRLLTWLLTRCRVRTMRTETTTTTSTARHTLSRQQLTALDRGEMILVPRPAPPLPVGYRIEGKGSSLGLATPYNDMPAGTVVDAIVRIDGPKQSKTSRCSRTPRVTHTLTPSSSWISGISYVRPAVPISSDPTLSQAYLVIWTRDPRTGAPRSALLYMIPPAVACKLPGLLKAGRVGKVQDGKGEPSTGRAYNRLVRGKYPEKTVSPEEMCTIVRNW